MNYKINDREPKSLFHFFEEITRIPRASGKEKGIADYLCRFAKLQGFAFYRDKNENVLIRVPGSEGKEDQPPVILQGHSDMVFVCDEEHTEHSWDKPLLLQYDGKEIFALGTSLGADDGIALAMMLALPEEKNLSHPPLELLFTTEEEVGMFGAKAFDASLLRGKTLINLDNDEEGVATVGCAGGRRLQLDGKLQTFRFPVAPALTLTLSGLQGGHSGIEIHLPRLNALSLMGEFLKKLQERIGFDLCSWKGGVVDNAIPSACEVSLVPTEPSGLDSLRREAERLAEELLPLWKATEPGALFSFCNGLADRRISREDLAHLLSLVEKAPHGVKEQNEEGFVISSLNFAQLSVEGDVFWARFSVRSCIESKKQQLCREIHTLAEHHQATVTESGDYPGWEPKEHSPLAERYLQLYERLFSRKASVASVHAGLECGVFAGQLPGLEILSFGAETKDVHTPKERLNADSFANAYRLLCALLSEL